MTLDGKVIIEVRGNEYTMRDRNPHVPWSPEEIAADAAACCDAGASIVHFHARDAEHRCDVGRCRGVRRNHAGDTRAVAMR